MAQTQKKTNSTSSRSGKSSSGKKSGNHRSKSGSSSNMISMGQEIGGLVLIAIAVWLFVTVLGFGGTLGKGFARVLFGLFGVAAYVFPLLLVAACIYILWKGKKNQVVLLGISFGALFLGICMLCQLINGEYSAGMSPFDSLQAGIEKHIGGGLIGGFFEWILRPNFGLLMNYLVAVIFMIVALVLITGQSFFEGVKDGSKAVARTTKAVGQHTREALAESEADRELRLQKKAQKREERDEKRSRMEQKRSGVTMDTLVGGGPSSTNISDNMKELKVKTPPAEKSAPVLQTIEKELQNGFFSNTKVETISNAAPTNDIPTYHDYREEENGQQSFTHELNPQHTEESQKSHGREKAKITEAEKEKETEDFAKTAATSSVVHNSNYKVPPLTLLKKGTGRSGASQDDYIRQNRYKLEETLRNFNVDADVVGVEVGPAVTRYEIQLKPGVKVSKITTLTDDIKLSLAASDIRIEAPIPGKSAVGIEVPNKENETIMLRDLLENAEYQRTKTKIAFAVGKDISGNVLVADITKMPHMLIAGATGSGKSVCINTLIMSILFKYSPEEVKLIMIDPKVVELSVYNGIPHLLSPVVSDMKKAAGALNWAVMEMERRYQLFAASNVRDLSGYNEKVRNLPTPDEEHVVLPQIVIIVDELADLMMVASNDVENAICRLAQKARAAGMHLILATQRPSVDVITGLIKANMPSRIAFSVSSGVDSRTILDMNGAERLLGKGDMLFYPQGYSAPKRVQGAFVTDDEVEQVVDFLKKQNESAEADESLAHAMEHANIASGSSSSSMNFDGGEERDELFAEAGRFIYETEKCTVGALQRRFRIGFNRAARIVDQLEEAGVVGPNEGTKPREIIMSPEQFEQYVEEYV